MIFNSIESDSIMETKITIEYNKLDKKIAKLIHLIKDFDKSTSKLLGIKEGETYCLNPQDIFYCEAIDRKTFLYTEKEVYESSLKLYQLEEYYQDFDYFRFSKSCLGNINKIKSIRPEFVGKLLVTMENNEKLYISRQYVPLFKKKLGMGGKEK